MGVLASSRYACAQFLGRAATSLGYHATESRGRRRAPSEQLESEDRTLTTRGRRKLQAQGRDIVRNFTIAGWMVRKHLDYVCEANFHSRTGDDGFDTDCEQLVRWWSGTTNFETSARFGLDKYIRMAEARKVLDGDFGTLKLANGFVQGIESDRIRNPDLARVSTSDGTEWIEGVKVVRGGGRALAYAIHRRARGGRGFEFERDVPASRLHLFGHFDRFDQTRGISPLAPSFNNLADVYENFDLAQAKAKISNLFAIAFLRDANGDEDGDQAAKKSSRGYEVDFGRGPLKLDLNRGDDVKFLESNTPSTQFQDFSRLMIMVALKALDMPFSLECGSNRVFFETGTAYEVTPLRVHLFREIQALRISALAECGGLFVAVVLIMKSNELTDEQRRSNAFSAWAMVGIDVWQHLEQDGEQAQPSSKPAIKKSRLQKRGREPPATS
ncbi:MAG: phage portal protein [Planctomycetaceae bacterium]|nr:phage portal protein [Planctomycetaceae bacterium]